MKKILVFTDILVVIVAVVEMPIRGILYLLTFGFWNVVPQYLIFVRLYDWNDKQRSKQGIPIHSEWTNIACCTKCDSELTLAQRTESNGRCPLCNYKGLHARNFVDVNIKSFRYKTVNDKTTKEWGTVNRDRSKEICR